MQRIYLPNTQFSKILEISDVTLYHQITRVLRARVWQRVIFFDGVKYEDIEYEIIHIDKKSVSFQKQNTIVKNSELDVEMSLYQAFPNKLSKLETIVQKCGEVGYSKIIFFESERSQKIVLSDAKKERLYKIAIEATEQCGGNVIPEMYYEAFFPWIGREFKWELYICHTEWNNSLDLSKIEKTGNISIIVWPEGGFSENEIQDISARKIYFWPRILRCETVWEVVWFYISQKKES